MTTSALDRDYKYPDPGDEEFQGKIYKKREYYFHSIPPRKRLVEYEDIRDFRDEACGGSFKLRPHQAFLSNFINPETPYKGLLLYHGVGTGKCVLPNTCVNTSEGAVQMGVLWRSSVVNVRPDATVERAWWGTIATPIDVTSVDADGNLVTRTVHTMYRQRVKEIVRTLRLENGATITATLAHRFLGSGGWTDDPKLGDRLAVPLAETRIDFMAVVGTELSFYDGYVYDLEVDELHNYVANNIVCHNTCSAIAIAEQFKEQVQKYGTKIHILVSGPLIKRHWRDDLIKCTKETYLKADTSYVNPEQQNQLVKAAQHIAQQYYKVMSYKSFYKRVLGQKIADTRLHTNQKLKKRYRKTTEGEYEREISIDRLNHLNNSLLIVDEAHNLTLNEYGTALKKIISNSKNLRVLLLTATPCINFADEIVELVNYIRPVADPILRDSVFRHAESELQLRTGGLDYLQRMCMGYVSHFRGANPLTFAVQEDQGEVPAHLLFTPVLRCHMLPFQATTYDAVVSTIDDPLDRKSQEVANFVFPGLDKAKGLIGLHGKDGLERCIQDLKANRKALQARLKAELFGGKVSDEETLYLENDGLAGKLFKMPHLANVSVKFNEAMLNILDLVDGRKGAGTAFVYSNLVVMGIQLFAKVLRANGFLEYQNDGNYMIQEDTIDAVTGVAYKDMRDKAAFHPATFITITGQQDDEGDQQQEEKKHVLDTRFSHVDNRDGRFIKVVLGSRVMNEGITLENTAEVHVLDVYYNLSKLHQVIGRAIRECKHYRVISDANRFPKVRVHRYVVSKDGGMTTEEETYQRAEQKHMLIKDVERALKEVAIDCPVLYNGNVFPEEREEYRGCVSIDRLKQMSEAERQTVQPCPSQCDFKSCVFECRDRSLTARYYDKDRSVFTRLGKEDLDYTTFTSALAMTEIEQVKDRIKEMYRFRYVFTLDELAKRVVKTYPPDKRALFDEFFLYRALDHLIPTSENDFNNFKDTIYDKFNVPGYLIHIKNFYIFQPFNQNEDVPMYYRSLFHGEVISTLSLYAHLRTSDMLHIASTATGTAPAPGEGDAYDFRSVIDYYDSRDDFDFVGIVDRASTRKLSLNENATDVFKIRVRRLKTSGRKRAEGMPSLTGSVCETSKDKDFLKAVTSRLDIQPKGSRRDICRQIKRWLMFMEKYATDKAGDKLTYLIVPANHPEHSFPFNLEDRVASITSQLKDDVPVNLNMSTTKQGGGTFDGERKKEYARYVLTVPSTAVSAKYVNALKRAGFAREGQSDWELVVE